MALLLHVDMVLVLVLVLVLGLGLVLEEPRTRLPSRPLVALNVPTKAMEYCASPALHVKPRRDEILK